jgi:hypothetical protein
MDKSRWSVHGCTVCHWLVHAARLDQLRSNPEELSKNAIQDANAFASHLSLERDGTCSECRVCPLGGVRTLTNDCKREREIGHQKHRCPRNTAHCRVVLNSTSFPGVGTYRLPCWRSQAPVSLVFHAKSIHAVLSQHISPGRSSSAQTLKLATRPF